MLLNLHLRTRKTRLDFTTHKNEQSLTSAKGQMKASAHDVRRAEGLAQKVSCSPAQEEDLTEVSVPALQANGSARRIRVSVVLAEDQSLASSSSVRWHITSSRCPNTLLTFRGLHGWHTLTHRHININKNKSSSP